MAAARRGELTVEVATGRGRPAPAPRLAVVQALAKGGRDEQAVEAMTEVGVDEVIGWEAARSVAQVDRPHGGEVDGDRAGGGEAVAPDLVADGQRAGVDRRRRRRAAPPPTSPSCCTSPRTEPLASMAVPDAGEVVVVVGPEGGDHRRRARSVRRRGRTRVVRLGDTVLRSSTAGASRRCR